MTFYTDYLYRNSIYRHTCCCTASLVLSILNIYAYICTDTTAYNSFFYPGQGRVGCAVKFYFSIARIVGKIKFKLMKHSSIADRYQICVEKIFKIKRRIKRWGDNYGLHIYFVCFCIKTTPSQLYELKFI